MPANGILAYEGETIVFGVDPQDCWAAQLTTQTGEVEKVAIVHCLPSDQAVDLYVFEAVNNEELIQSPPFELFYDRSRAMRVLSGEKDSHQITMNSGAIARVLLSHVMNPNSNSVS